MLPNALRGPRGTGDGVYNSDPSCNVKTKSVVQEKKFTDVALIRTIDNLNFTLLVWKGNQILNYLLNKEGYLVSGAAVAFEVIHDV